MIPWNRVVLCWDSLNIFLLFVVRCLGIIFLRMPLSPLEVIYEKRIPCEFLFLEQFWVSVRERLQTKAIAWLLSFPQRAQVPNYFYSVFNVNQNMEASFFPNCSLNHVGNAVWKEICNLGTWGKIPFWNQHLQIPESSSSAPHTLSCWPSVSPNNHTNTFFEIMF